MKPGETVEHEGATFAVERVERHRIRRLRYTPAPPADARVGDAETNVAAD
jgi:hypothetical protein